MSCAHEGLQRLKIAFLFTPRVAGGREGQFAAECAPLRLEVFGTRELSCRTHQILLHDLGVSRLIELEFFVHRAKRTLSLPFCDAGVGNNSDYAEENARGVCAHSSAIVANLYARTWSESGQRIWTSLGAALMPLTTLLSMRRSRQVHRMFSVVLEREIDSPQQPSSPPIKGLIEITSVVGEQVALRSVRLGDIYHCAQRIADVRAQMAAMIARGQGSFFGPSAYLRPTIDALMPFHVPTNQTDFMLLPSSSYTMLAPREPLSVPYFEQLLQIGLQRSNLSTAEALELALGTRTGSASRAQRALFASFVVRAMSAFALSQCYMDDVTNLNEQGGVWRADLVCSDEDFKLCRLCGGDDCEGCALEPHMHVNQLCACASAELLQQMSPLLLQVRSFLRTFVPCLTLGCVTNKQMTIEELDQNNATAHTFAVLVPFRLFERMLAPEERAAVTQGSRFAADRAADVAAWRGIDECPLICEGTAPIDPAMRPTAAYYDGGEDARSRGKAEEAVLARRSFVNYAIRCIQSMQSANRIGLEISGLPAQSALRDQSTFYKYIVSFGTNAFADRMHCDFVIVYERDRPAQRTFGVRFADFINGSELIGLVPYLVYTKQETAIVDAVLADQQPIPNLVLPAPLDDRRPPAPADAQLRYDLLKQRKPPLALADARLHARRQYATIRWIDVDEPSVRAVEAIVSGPLTRGFDYKIFTLSASIDGTRDHNWAIDFYFDF